MAIQVMVLGLTERMLRQLMAPGIVILGYILYRTRLLFGGADATVAWIVQAAKSVR